MNISLLGIDLAKNIFQLHAVDQHGKSLLKQQLKRDKLMAFMANLPCCLIAMEACSSANYWAREFIKLGHRVKLISPQYVKPFVQGNKNDRNDAKAITEAASRAEMPSVPIKTIAQQDIQNLHNVRQRLVTQRTALSNQLRGMLAESGIVMAKGLPTLRKRLPEILEDAENQLTAAGRELIHDLQAELYVLNVKILSYEQKLKVVFKATPACQRIAAIEGIGVITATALVARIGDPQHFKNGRHFAAFLGLVPRQHSSGGREQLYRISKRGDSYLRTLLIHGARSVMLRIKYKSDARSRWLTQLSERRGVNRTCVALANKNARIVWALLANEANYRQAA